MDGFDKGEGEEGEEREEGGRRDLGGEDGGSLVTGHTAVLSSLWAPGITGGIHGSRCA